MTRIAIDMMGSDLGPEELAQAIRLYRSTHQDKHLVLFGDETKLKQLFSDDSDDIEICGTESVIPMEIGPLDFLRQKNSSMYQAIMSLKSGYCDGMVSAGSTGGLVTGATILLKNIPGVKRAGLCTPFPTSKKGVPAVIMDVGANKSNTGEDIRGFALMGRIYATEVLGISHPKAYVLSNGTEEGKGADEVVEAYRLLKESGFPDFMGNVEARNVLDGEHDLIVTGGFVGNVYLKATEGMASLMNQMIKASFKRNLLTKIGYLLSSKGFKEMKETMNYRRYGGAILLGVNGVVVKAHGNSNAYAFSQAISVAERMIDCHIISKIEEEFHD